VRATDRLGIRGLVHAKQPARPTDDPHRVIRRALEIAHPGDLVIVAGKGHEAWQALRGRQEPFDDRLVIREELP